VFALQLRETTIPEKNGPQFTITKDCLVLPFGVQRKSPRRDVVRIPQREKETLQTRVGLSVQMTRLPFHRSESAKDVPARVQNHSQSVRMPVAAAVKVISIETIAGAAPEKSKFLFLEILEERWKVMNDHGIPPTE
jgi:hypothetical protein